MCFDSDAGLSANFVDQVLVVGFSGDICDPIHEDFLRGNLEYFAKVQKSGFVMNLEGVSRLPSAIMGQLVAIHRKLQSTGFVLCCLSPGVTEQLLVTRLNKVFTVVEDQEEALEHLQG